MTLEYELVDANGGIQKVRVEPATRSVVATWKYANKNKKGSFRTTFCYKLTKWQPHSWWVVQLTGRTNLPSRIMPQVLFSPCEYLSRLQLHPPAIRTCSQGRSRQLDYDTYVLWHPYCQWQSMYSLSKQWWPMGRIGWDSAHIPEFKSVSELICLPQRQSFESHPWISSMRIKMYRRLSKIHPWVMNLSWCSMRGVGIFSRTLSPENRPTPFESRPILFQSRPTQVLKNF